MTTDRLRTWARATRVYSLGASTAPMMVVLGALLRSGSLRLLPFLLAFVVALAAQISSNFANDYFDFKGGRDTSKRVGFSRVLVTGEVTPRQMRVALLISTGITIVAGLAATLLTGAWGLLAVGVAVVVGIYAYSSGPFAFSTHGLGDVAVVVFYGLTPILATYWAIAGTPPLCLLLLALGLGMWEDNILVCNNYRDYAEDRDSGKVTLIVRMGERFGPLLYRINAAATILLVTAGIGLATESLPLALAAALLAAAATLPLTILIGKYRGPELNRLLKLTNMVTLFLGALLLLLQLV